MKRRARITQLDYHTDRFPDLDSKPSSEQEMIRARAARMVTMFNIIRGQQKFGGTYTMNDYVEGKIV